MTTDRFGSLADDADNPARQAFAVTPSDSAELPILPKALIVGGGGALVLRAVDSAVDVTVTVLAGQMLPIRAQFVRATGTSASNIVGLA